MTRLAGYQPKPPTRFDNHSGELIPRFAVLRIVDTDAAKQHALKAFKPNGTTTGCTFALNTKRDVADEQAGSCTTDYAAWALYDHNGGADVPAIGEEWGPDNDWLLHKGKAGFRIVGGAESFTLGATTYRRVRVAVASGAAPTKRVEVTTAITAATAWGTWGTGQVQDRDHAGAVVGDPYEVENWYRETFIVGEVVTIDPNYSPPQVVYGPPGRVIYAQANAPSGVLSTDASFSFDNAREIVGECPASGAGTAQNQYGQVYANNEWVLLFYDEENDKWLTERGGTAGSQVIYFELTQDMKYADVAKLAKPVNAGGFLDSAADPFYVIDGGAQNGDGIGQFYGLAADSEFMGYRGFAWKFVDDWNATGVPGWRIIDMEGPAAFLPVEIVNPGTELADCAILEDREPYGLPDRGRRPRPASGSFDVVVKDLLKIATDKRTNQRWIVAWDEPAEAYTFWHLLDDFHIVRFSSPGVYRTTDTFTIADGDYSVVRGVKPTGSLTIKNLPKCDCPSGQEMFARFNYRRGLSDLKQCWDTGDGGNIIWFLRGLADFYPNASHEANWQVIENYGEIEPHWHDGGECET